MTTNRKNLEKLLAKRLSAEQEIEGLNRMKLEVEAQHGATLQRIRSGEESDAIFHELGRCRAKNDAIPLRLDYLQQSITKLDADLRRELTVFIADLSRAYLDKADALKTRAIQALREFCDNEDECQQAAENLPALATLTTKITGLSYALSSHNQSLVDVANQLLAQADDLRVK